MRRTPPLPKHTHTALTFLTSAFLPSILFSSLLTSSSGLALKQASTSSSDKRLRDATASCVILEGGLDGDDDVEDDDADNNRRDASNRTMERSSVAHSGVREKVGRSPPPEEAEDDDATDAPEGGGGGRMT